MKCDGWMYYNHAAIPKKWSDGDIGSHQQHERGGAVNELSSIYRMHGSIGRNGNLRAQTNAHIAGGTKPVGWDIFDRGLCLPSDNKMTEEQQDRIIQVIRACFE